MGCPRRELIYRNYQILRLHNRIKFDAAFGTSVSIAHLSAIKGIPSFNLNEDDDDVVPLYSLLTYPFAPSILHPQCIRFKRWRKKRVFYPSYHELAYLHPNNFTPDSRILGKYNLEEKKYVETDESITMYRKYMCKRTGNKCIQTYKVYGG